MGEEIGKEMNAIFAQDLSIYGVRLRPWFIRAGLSISVTRFPGMLSLELSNPNLEGAQFSWNGVYFCGGWSVLGSPFFRSSRCDGSVDTSVASIGVV